MKAPVITIDGPSGTGKGTIVSMLASSLGWHTLDSGAIYRAIAWAVLDAVVNPKDEQAIVELIARSDIKILKPSVYEPAQVLCDDREITQLIRIEEVGMVASQISKFPQVRLAVLGFQRDFRQSPGLITDGRDMGTVVFPDADLKIYLDADSEVRAQRRYLQLQQKGIDVSLEEVKLDLAKRDSQDQGREVAPLKPAKDAYVIDTTRINAEVVFTRVMQLVRENLIGAMHAN